MAKCMMSNEDKFKIILGYELVELSVRPRRQGVEYVLTIDEDTSIGTVPRMLATGFTIKELVANYEGNHGPVGK